MFLSDVLPTAWQSVEYAAIPDGGTLLVIGLGPIGDMASRIALHRGHRVIAVDLVPERLDRVGPWRRDRRPDRPRRGLGEVLRSLTDGRGADSVIDAVGMEAHGSPVGKFAQSRSGCCPTRWPRRSCRPPASTGSTLYSAIDAVRRGGTISLIGLYGGTPTRCP